jgi:hypothetical protein
MARLALDPRGRELLDDAEFMGRLKMVAAHPEMLNGMLGDAKMQLVRGHGVWGVPTARGRRIKASAWLWLAPQQAKACPADSCPEPHPPPTHP